jgi:hypothetical protein
MNYNNKLYQIYANIRYRCYTKTCPVYHRYGGRGIKMSNEWFNSYHAFRDWSMQHGYADNLYIDRINNDGNYEPENCQWITRAENTRKANKIHQHRHANASKYYYGISPNGIYYYFENANKFSKKHNLNANGVRRVARGERNNYKGWKFGYIKTNI